ncbi:hypothetical protein, partial [Bacillus cereus]|uniref:hypothetical protein n=1 Tax=Bacillus cereus TaxID=1396 RepID=UPI001CEF7A2F
KVYHIFWCTLYYYSAFFCKENKSKFILFILNEFNLFQVCGHFCGQWSNGAFGLHVLSKQY